MKKSFFFLSIALAATLFTGCQNRNRMPAFELNEIPEAYYTPADQQGNVVTMTYSITADTGIVAKSAQVYLPYGYDATDTVPRYNVLYLAHGGNDNSRSFFDGSHGSLPLGQILDHLIASGKMQPLIVVGVTYYPDDSGRVHYGMKQTIDLCRDFHNELETTIIPAVGMAFPGTFLASADHDGIVASRQHRAYGGFSMGSLSTWYQIINGLDVASAFIPLSGDCWIYDQGGQKISFDATARIIDKKVVEQGYTKRDFRVFALTGSKDVACGAETSLVEALATEDAPNFVMDKNMTLKVLEDGGHSYFFINRYLYNVLPVLF